MNDSINLTGYCFESFSIKSLISFLILDRVVMSRQDTPKETLTAEEETLLDSFGSIKTSALWTMLDTVVQKLNKKSSPKMYSSKEIDRILVKAGETILLKHGIFRNSFGVKYMPIVLTNPSFAKALATHSVNILGVIAKGVRVCRCGLPINDE